MKTFTQQELEKMSLLEIRKVARKLGITDIAGKRQNEIVRKILTKQKPGGVDPRVKPKEAAAAKKKTKAEPKPKAAKKTKAKTKAAPKEDIEEPTFSGTLEQRVARIEMALVGAGIMDAKMDKKKPATKTPPSVEQAVLPSEWFDEDGNLSLTPEDIESMNFDSILAVNNLLGDYAADIPESQRKTPRLARMRLVQALRKIGDVEQGEGDDEPEEEGELVEIEPNEESPFPPEEVGDQCYIKDEKGRWFAGLVVDISEKDGEPWYLIRYTVGDAVIEEEVDVEELKPWEPDEEEEAEDEEGEEEEYEEEDEAEEEEEEYEEDEDE